MVNITKAPKANIPVIAIWYVCDYQTMHADLPFHTALPPIALLSLWWVSNPYFVCCV